jgi:hypothetical protein
MNIIKLKKEYRNIYGLPIISYVDTRIFTLRYPETSCLDLGCRDICCSGGAIMDIVAVNKLKGRGLFAYAEWNSFTFERDPYYPGGKGCYTPVKAGRCIFQNPLGSGCAIHSYCLQNRIPVQELKFFACCLFPSEVNTVDQYENVLTPGYELRHPDYSFPCKNTGTSTVYDMVLKDILYYFGLSLVDELEVIKKEISMNVKGSV